jgi:hypothetical protein
MQGLVKQNIIDKRDRISFKCVLHETRYMRSSMAPRSERFNVLQRASTLSNVEQSLDGWPKIYYREPLRAPPPSEGMLTCWSQLHLQSLWPTNQHGARVMGYGPFSIRKACAPPVGALTGFLHKESLCPSSGGINRLMMCFTLIICFTSPRISTDNNMTG